MSKFQIIWDISYCAVESFKVDVDSLLEAAKAVNLLADYDAYRERITGRNLSNSFTLLLQDDNEEWCDENGNMFDEIMRAIWYTSSKDTFAKEYPEYLELYDTCHK